MKKLHFEDKLIHIFFIIFYGYNIFNFTNIAYTLPNKNAYAFWNGVTHANINISYLVMLMPIIIGIIVSSIMEQKYKGTILQNQITRIGYKKSIFLTIYEISKKIIKPFLLYNLIIFIIGFVFLPHEIIKTDTYHPFVTFTYDGVFSPYIYMLLKLLASIIFIITIINIAMIVYKLLKNFASSVAITFVGCNIYNFLIFIIFGSMIGNIISNKQINKYLYLMNFYEGYIVENNIIASLFNSSLYLIITIIILIFAYKEKDWILLK